jgi:transcription initiation factor TFIID subunit 11
MASPPYAQSPTAISPPYPAPAQLPGKKRPSDGAQSSHKRRKASALSVTSAASAHPLRQTSFPPEARGRSASVDTQSIVSGSQVSAISGPPKKKRGRKPKGYYEALNAENAAAAAKAGKAGTAVSGTGDGNQGEDEEDDNDMQMGVVDGETRTQEQKQEEIRLRAMLVENFDPDQMARYEQWRAGKLTESVVKRVRRPSMAPRSSLYLRTIADKHPGRQRHSISVSAANSHLGHQVSGQVLHRRAY